MKSIGIIASIALNCALIGYLSLISFKTTSNKDEHKKSAKSSKEHKIAIVTPVSHPSLEKIEYGLRETLAKEGHDSYECVTYNANGSQQLLRAQLEEVLQQKYDLICTIATYPSIMAKELTAKKGITTPIVFAAVADPVRIQLIDGITKSGNNVVGSIETNDYEKQLSLLSNFKPGLKNLLLVYDPSQGSGLELDKQKVMAIAQNLGITVHVVPVYQSNEVYPKTAAAITVADAIIVLIDSTVVCAIDGLIKLCNQHKIPLMTSELDSVKKGATFGFGVPQSDYGVISARLVLQILEQGINPQELQSQLVDQFKLGINHKALNTQGIVLDPMTEFLCSSCMIIQKDQP